MRPPTEDTVSKAVYDQYAKEEEEIFNGLRFRANLLSEKLNSIDGISCNQVEGAMYAFPKIDFPESYCEVAKNEGFSPDLK